MKSFFKYLLASILGFFLSIFLIFFVFFLIGTIAASSFKSESEVKVKKNSVLVAELDYPVKERTRKMDLFVSPFGDIESTIGLYDLTEGIEKAMDDDKIDGLFLDLTALPNGMATNEEIRDALLEFKGSGKFIYAYSENYFNNNYYIASVADEIYMQPEGTILLNGMSSERMFFKDMLDKIGVKTTLVRPKDNAYKSAGESFIRTDMSESSKEQTLSYLNGMYAQFQKGVTAERDLTVADLNAMADNLTVRSPQDAVKMGLLDGLKYRDEVMDILREKCGTEEDDDLNSVSLIDYAKKSAKGDYSKERIAVVYANGEIRSGEGDDDIIGSERIARALKNAREDEKVKAIVFRVNSPGGSALASDVILREARLASKEKPFIVSMGNVAASGGYYISAYADKIYAQPNTITGSIGVFGLLPNTEELFEEKMGITFDRVKTNKYADLLNPMTENSEEEMALIQEYVEDVYGTFTGIVSEGRNIPIDSVRALARGRVYTGIQAKELGLVDEIGGLEVAIAEAATIAELEEYSLKSFPKLKDPFQEILESISADMMGPSTIEQHFEREIKALSSLKHMIEDDRIQMRLEFDEQIR